MSRIEEYGQKRQTMIGKTQTKDCTSPTLLKIGVNSSVSETDDMLRSSSRSSPRFLCRLTAEESRTIPALLRSTFRIELC
jgi:hypothetical protein